MSVLERFDLSGKVAVVTGGNRGLGEAWVRSLVDVGATVVIAAVTRSGRATWRSALAARSTPSTSTFATPTTSLARLPGSSNGTGVSTSW